MSSALQKGLKFMERRVNGSGGAIAISSTGDVDVAFSTQKMSWAYIKDQKLHYGIHPNQHEVEEFP